MALTPAPLAVRRVAGLWRPFSGLFGGPLDTRSRPCDTPRVVTTIAARSPLAARPQPAIGAGVSALIYSIFAKVFCIECGALLNEFDMYGRIDCMNCKTVYLIKRIHSKVAATFYEGENDRKQLIIPSPNKRTYLPGLQSELIEFEADESKSDTSPVLNATVCCVCHERLENILSVRVQRPFFIDYEDQQIHPISGLEYTEIKTRPSFRIGRAHSDCALQEESKPYGMRMMVEPRTIPNKRERSIGSRENDKFIDKFKPIDPAEITDFE